MKIKPVQLLARVLLIALLLSPGVAHAQVNLHLAKPQWISGMTTFALNSTTRKCAGFFQGKAGTVSYIGVSVVSITGTSPTYDCRLETHTNQAPSGTLIAAGANVTTQFTAGWHWYAISTPPTVTAGQTFTAVVGYSSGTADGSNFATINLNPALQNSYIPQAYQNTGSWAGNLSTPVIAVKYSDGTILPSFPVTSQTDNIYSTSNTPDTYATLWTQPFTGYCSGFGMPIRIAASASAIVELLDSSNNVLATRTILANDASAAGTRQMIDELWEAPVLLGAGRSYRISVRAADTNTIRVWSHVWDSTAERNIGFGLVQGSTRKGSGAWTDTALTTNLIWPVFGTSTQVFPAFRSPVFGGARP